MKIIMAIIVLGAALTATAQKKELLNGSWKFNSVADEEKLDQNTVKEAKVYFGKMEIEFLADGKCSFNPFAGNSLTSFSGTWSLNKEETQVSVTASNASAPNKSQTSVWGLNGLTKNELRLNMGKAVIVFGRNKEAENKEAEASAAKAGLTEKIVSKTHTVYAYPGWAGIFPDQEKYYDLRSDYRGKKPAEIFKEAPDSWIKKERSIYSLNFIFSESEKSSLQNEKKWFIDLAKNRTGWDITKIKPIEDKITLPDGRKGLLLFYVCPDTKGMVGGNYFNCNLYVESADNKTTIICYKVFIEGGNPPLPASDALAWKEYFKKILLHIRPN